MKDNVPSSWSSAGLAFQASSRAGASDRPESSHCDPDGARVRAPAA